MSPRKYPSDNNQNEFERQRWNGGAEVELSVLLQQLQSIGHSPTEIDLIMNLASTSLAAEGYHYALQQQSCATTVIRLLEEHKKCRICAYEIIPTLQHIHSLDVQKAQAHATACEEGHYDTLKQLSDLLSYQVSPDEVPLKPGDMERFAGCQHLQQAQTLLDSCRSGSTFMNGRELWQCVCQYKISPESIGSTPEEIQQLADASFHFGIKGNN